MKILSIGEFMVEMKNTSPNTYEKGYAGDTFNFAYYMRQLCPADWDIQYGTVFGNQAEDQNAINFIKSKNIGIDRIQSHPSKTIGLFLLSNTDDGEKQYGYWRSDSAARTFFNTVQSFDDFDMVYLSGITAAISNDKETLITSIKNTYNSGVKIAYDLQHRRQLWSLTDGKEFFTQIIEFCNVVKISDEEWEWLYQNEKTIDQLSIQHPNIEIILTCGENPSQRWLNGECTDICPTKTVDKVIDSSAAGDSFIATYLTNTLLGKTPMTALENASAVSSKVLQYKGSLIPESIIKKR